MILRRWVTGDLLMTPPYRFLSFTAPLLTPGTRKRPPYYGFVQVWFEEMMPKGVNQGARPDVISPVSGPHVRFPSRLTIDCLRVGSKFRCIRSTPMGRPARGKLGDLPSSGRAREV